MLSVVDNEALFFRYFTILLLASVTIKLLSFINIRSREPGLKAGSISTKLPKTGSTAPVCVSRDIKI